MTDVASRVAAEMDDRDVSGRKLARQLGVSQKWVQRRLAGAVEFRPSDLDRIAAALGVPVTRFLGDQPVVTP